MGVFISRTGIRAFTVHVFAALRLSIPQCLCYSSPRTVAAFFLISDRNTRIQRSFVRSIVAVHPAVSMLFLPTRRRSIANGTFERHRDGPHPHFECGVFHSNADSRAQHMTARCGVAQAHWQTARGTQEYVLAGVRGRPAEELAGDHPQARFKSITRNTIWTLACRLAQ